MPLSLSLSLSLFYPRLSLSPVPIFLSLSNPGLSSYLYLSLPPTPVFLIFLSHTLSLFLSFLSFSLPSRFLSLFFLTLISFSRSLSLSLSLSPIPVSFSFSFSNPYFSLSHSCLSFHLFSLSSLSSSSFSPTDVSLCIFVSPLSLLLPPCGSLSPSLFLPFSLPPMSHFLYPSLSFSLTPVSLSLSFSLSLPRKKENIKLYCNIEKENL